MRKRSVPSSPPYPALTDFGEDTDQWILPASQAPANHDPGLQGLPYTLRHKHIHSQKLPVIHAPAHNHVHSYFSHNCGHAFTCKGWASVHRRNMPLQGCILPLPTYTHTHYLLCFLVSFPQGVSALKCAKSWQE